MNELFREFYVQPMDQIYFEAAAMFFLWLLVMLPLRGRARRAVACVGLTAALTLIVLFTLWNRSSDGSRRLELTPLISFAKAKLQPEFYRTMFMNMLLFLPFGLSFPFVLPQRKKWLNPLLTVAAGAALSVTVETAQYVFRLGKCETDDVLMNALGAAIGVCAYLLCVLSDRLRHPRGKRAR